MKIRVTQEHIDNGVRGSCISDPIALAMKEAGLRDVWVSPDYIKWSKDGVTFYQPTSDQLRRFMVDFDNKRSPAPFEFEYWILRAD